MRSIPIKNLRMGMIIESDILSDNGRVVLAENNIIDEQAINRLKFYAIPSIEVSDDYGYDKPPTELTQDNVASVKIVFENAGSSALPKSDSGKAIHIDKATYQNMKQQLLQSPTANLKKQTQEEGDFRKRKGYKKLLTGYSAALKTTRALFSKIKNGENVSDSQFISLINDAFDMNNESFSLFEWFNIIKDLNDPIYAQSLNAALLCRALGKWLSMSESDCNVLAVCGLLHDIGKLTVDPAILNKPGNLTDAEFSAIRSHPIAGFDMVKKLEIDPRVKKAILQHHERNDGSGYPFHRVQSEIHPFSQITAICDVYIAMTSGRSHRKSLCPFDVIHNFEQSGMAMFNGRYLFTFLENIALSYQHNTVILNDGRSGNIIMLNRNNYSSPVVQLSNGEFLDLSQSPELQIIGLK
ncbi:MAG: HD domain-containing protein [Eubacterium sp.]|nr:HD domain-containing protein [Eubacterium sp.]